MKLHVVNPGILSTIQDQGRKFWRPSGVPVGGAADPESAEIAQILLGNQPNSAVLEFSGGVFKALIEEGGLLSFVGNGGQLILQGEPVVSGKVYSIKKGDQVEIEPTSNGCYAYLTCEGGWKAEEILGSKSPCLPGGFGRAIQAGDVLESEQTSSSAWKTSNWFVTQSPVLTTVRVLAGPEASTTSSALEALLSGVYEIGTRRNRMGVQLIPTQPHALPDTAYGTMVSTGVFPGIIQMPPDRRPFVLMADSQTTGGYPRIAIIVAADLARFGQIPSGSRINFQLVNLKEAEAAWKAYRRRLDKLKFAIHGVR